jgi:hypothetical protein
MSASSGGTDAVLDAIGTFVDISMAGLENAEREGALVLRPTDDQLSCMLAGCAAMLEALVWVPPKRRTESLGELAAVNAA